MLLSWAGTLIFQCLTQKFTNREIVINYEYLSPIEFTVCIRIHSLAIGRLLQGFNRGQIAIKAAFAPDYALKLKKVCRLPSRE
jgi:hypothetical protein